jgi:hypothetical protein
LHFATQVNVLSALENTPTAWPPRSAKEHVIAPLGTPTPRTPPVEHVTALAASAVAEQPPALHAAVLDVKPAGSTQLFGVHDNAVKVPDAPHTALTTTAVPSVHRTPFVAELTAMALTTAWVHPPATHCRLVTEVPTTV